MSKQSFLFALLAVSAFVLASMAGVWLATREPPIAGTVTSQPLPSPRAEAVVPPREDPVASGPRGSEADFTPGNPGQLTVAVSSHGAAAGIPVPVIVLPPPRTLEPRGAASLATEAPPATAASRESGETMRGRGRGRELGGGARGAGRR